MARSSGRHFPSNLADAPSSYGPSLSTWCVSSLITVRTLINRSTLALPSWDRPLQEHCDHTHSPLSWWCLRICTPIKLWVRPPLSRLFSSLTFTTSALIADIWGPRDRGIALAAFVVAPFAGPGIGPTIGGYIVQSGADWRWVLWVLAILVSLHQVPPTGFLMRFQAGFCWLVIIFTMPETFE